MKNQKFFLIFGKISFIKIIFNNKCKWVWLELVIREEKNLLIFSIIVNLMIKCHYLLKYLKIIIVVRESIELNFHLKMNYWRFLKGSWFLSKMYHIIIILNYCNRLISFIYEILLWIWDIVYYSKDYFLNFRNFCKNFKIEILLILLRN